MNSIILEVHPTDEDFYTMDLLFATCIEVIIAAATNLRINLRSVLDKKPN